MAEARHEPLPAQRRRRAPRRLRRRPRGRADRAPTCWPSRASGPARVPSPDEQRVVHVGTGRGGDADRQRRGGQLVVGQQDHRRADGVDHLGCGGGSATRGQPERQRCIGGELHTGTGRQGADQRPSGAHHGGRAQVRAQRVRRTDHDDRPRQPVTRRRAAAAPPAARAPRAPRRRPQRRSATCSGVADAASSTADRPRYAGPSARSSVRAVATTAIRDSTDRPPRERRAIRSTSSTSNSERRPSPARWDCNSPRLTYTYSVETLMPSRAAASSLVSIPSTLVDFT